LVVNPTQVVQQATPLPDHLQETTPRVMVFGVGFKMSGQALNPLAEECNLHLWRSGVCLMHSKLLDHLTSASGL